MPRQKWSSVCFMLPMHCNSTAAHSTIISSLLCKCVPLPQDSFKNKYTESDLTHRRGKICLLNKWVKKKLGNICIYRSEWAKKERFHSLLTGNVRVLDSAMIKSKKSDEEKACKGSEATLPSSNPAPSLGGWVI